MNLLEIIRPSDKDLEWLVPELFRRSGKLYEECGRWQDAAKCWIQAGEVGQAADIYLQSNDYSRAAPLLLAGGRYNEALDCYRHWLSSVATSDTEGRLKALLGIAASLILETAKPHKAKEAYRSARELIEDEIDRDPFTAGRYWEVLGEYGVTIGRSDLIQLGYEKALSCYSADHNGERLQTAQVYLAAVRDNRLLAADIETRLAQWRTLQTEDELLSSKVIHLRSEPLTVSEDDFKEVFKLNENWRPLEYIENDFEDRGETVMDHATGLLWQKSGSSKWLTYEEAQAYVQKLNQEQFAGHNDWRLPTIDELTSLLEPERQSNGLYINPIFDSKQWWCWSSDRRSPGGAWNVYFDFGSVHWSYLRLSYVRVVRS
jgi:tetratricopeptide (TPR) repeat protein